MTDVPLPGLEVPVIEIAPVTIEHEQDHPFEKQEKRGCARCGRGKLHVDHHGAPPSLNVLGSGNPHIYRTAKENWQELLTRLLTEAELPMPLTHVLAEGEITFPDRRARRDQGNFRFFIEKALGDALDEGGWLPDDSWDFYEFGGLARRYEKGVSRTRLMIFPTG